MSGDLVSEGGEEGDIESLIRQTEHNLFAVEVAVMVAVLTQLTGVDPLSAELSEFVRVSAFVIPTSTVLYLLTMHAAFREFLARKIWYSLLKGYSHLGFSYAFYKMFTHLYKWTSWVLISTGVLLGVFLIKFILDLRAEANEILREKREREGPPGVAGKVTNVDFYTHAHVRPSETTSPPSYPSPSRSAP